MRTFVVSDIHGNNESFRKALKFVKLKKNDTLIILGDLIDRGFDSKGVLDTVILLKEHDFNVICLFGNHEDMFLNAFSNTENLQTWLLNGGKETLSSFLTSSIEKIPTTYIELIKNFKYYHTFGKYIFVHAALNMHLKDPFSDLKTMLWERNQDRLLNSDWLGDKTLIHGHNPTYYKDIIEIIKSKNQIICIDNGSFIKQEGYGHICILQIENCEINFIK